MRDQLAQLNLMHGFVLSALLGLAIAFGPQVLEACEQIGDGGDYDVHRCCTSDGTCTECTFRNNRLIACKSYKI